jgi:LPXTG-motif cell wall-anchored protein
MVRRNAKILLVFLFVFGLVLSGFQGQVSAAEQVAKGTITVEGNTGTLVPQTAVTYEQGETAFDVLVKAVGENNVHYSNESYGKMITGINGLEVQGTFFWGFYINGISAPIGADSYKVHDGDQVSFRYIDWTKTPENTASVKVVGNNNKVLITPLPIEIIGHPTAFQFLQVAIGAENVGYSDSQYGKMINTIKGLAAGGSNYWAFYVNGKMASVGADSYPLQPGDQISFQYESWQAPTNGDPNGGTAEPAKTGTATKEMIQKALNGTSQYVLKNQVTDWEAIALKQAGKSIPLIYLENAKKLVKEKNGHFSKITDTERHVLGILAAGADPTTIEGYNLVKSIYNGNVTKQGLNGVAYALIALDSANFQVPNSAIWTRQKLENQLLEKQNKDGGWTWEGSTTSDPDTTAMVLTALAPYKNQVNVKTKVNSAVQFLSKKFLDGKIDNSSTAAQVVIALSALNIDANGALFTKENSSLMNFLLSFQNTDGGFDWQGGDKSDIFSTEQGVQALAAYKLKLEGKGSLYHLPLQVTQQQQVVKKPASQQGHPLPNTATNSLNLLTIGMLLVLIGFIFYAMQKKRYLK